MKTRRLKKGAYAPKGCMMCGETFNSLEGLFAHNKQQHQTQLFKGMEELKSPGGTISEAIHAPDPLGPGAEPGIGGTP